MHPLNGKPILRSASKPRISKRTFGSKKRFTETTWGSSFEAFRGGMSRNEGLTNGTGLHDKGPVNLLSHLNLRAHGGWKFWGSQWPIDWIPPTGTSCQLGRSLQRISRNEIMLKSKTCTSSTGFNLQTAHKSPQACFADTWQEWTEWRASRRTKQAEVKPQCYSSIARFDFERNFESVCGSLVPCTVDIDIMLVLLLNLKCIMCMFNTYWPHPSVFLYHINVFLQGICCRPLQEFVFCSDFQNNFENGGVFGLVWVWMHTQCSTWDSVHFQTKSYVANLPVTVNTEV